MPETTDCSAQFPANDVEKLSQQVVGFWHFSPGPPGISSATMQNRVIVVGGGAAGFFAAITCAETSPGAAVTLLEKRPGFLSKVRISGGGRCNVTHACFDPSQLALFYPRGGPALIGPFHKFQPRDTIAWFESRGVKLKTEADGRLFPITDSSQTIVDCLIEAARTAGVKLIPNTAAIGATTNLNGQFSVDLGNGRILESDLLMLATGGCRTAVAGQVAVSLGHKLESPVASLFTFHVIDGWVRDLAGISVGSVEISVPDSRLRERGAVLLTHSGLSGPAVLRLSAWGARILHGLSYQFRVQLNWLPDFEADVLTKKLEKLRTAQPARLIVNSPIPPLAARLWEALVLVSGIPRETRWADLSNALRQRLINQLRRTELEVNGKTLNQDEFVTCGGVRLSEINFKTMESRICARLYFGGELLDIDGITGGFNFQSAWTTGWIAGKAMGERLKDRASGARNSAA